jgi:hypothetical protein
VTKKTGLDGIGSFQKQILLWFADQIVWYDALRTPNIETTERVLDVWFRLPKKIPVGGKNKRIGRFDLHKLLRRGLLGEHWHPDRNRFYLTRESAPFVAAAVRFKCRQLYLF